MEFSRSFFSFTNAFSHHQLGSKAFCIGCGLMKGLVVSLYVKFQKGIQTVDVFGVNGKVMDHGPVHHL